MIRIQNTILYTSFEFRYCEINRFSNVIDDVGRTVGEHVCNVCDPVVKLIFLIKRNVYEMVRGEEREETKKRGYKSSGRYTRNDKISRIHLL